MIKCEHCGKPAPEGIVIDPKTEFVLCAECEAKSQIQNLATFVLQKLGLLPDPDKHAHCETCGQWISPGTNLCQICASFTRFVDEPKLVSQNVPDNKTINPEDLK